VSGAPRGSDFEVREADWLDVDVARERILADCRALPQEDVLLGDSAGRALAEDVVATATLPPWDNSAMDGYAVRASDIAGATEASPVRLPVAGVIRAGHGERLSLEHGVALRIMTGAPIPDGADTVVRVEDTDAEVNAGIVSISSARDARRHVRAAGQDMRSGDVLLRRGHAITPGTVGVLAAAGRSTIAVHGVPSVAVLSTGDELRPVEQYRDVQEGRGVPESNGPMLAALVREAGGHAIDLGIALDEHEALDRAIESGHDADVLITIGGASMGEADLVKRVLHDRGFELDFWRVTMRPGSPISFGWLTRGDRRQAVFSLPGNPSSAFVTFEVFVRPFLLRMGGHARIERRRLPCLAGERFDTPAALTYIQRVSLQVEDGALTAHLTGPQVSGLVRGLAAAEGLAIIGPDKPCLEPGDGLEVMLLDTGPAALPFDVG